MIHVAQYLGDGQDVDSAAVERELEGLLDLTQPGWRQEVVTRRFLPQLVVSPALVTAAQGGTAGRPGPAVPDVPGLWVMTGDSGTSFKTAPAIGICLAEWIVDGSPRMVDLYPFRSTRFAEGSPWLDERSYGDDRALTVSR